MDLNDLLKTFFLMNNTSKGSWKIYRNKTI